MYLWDAPEELRPTRIFHQGYCRAYIAVAIKSRRNVSEVESGCGESLLARNIAPFYRSLASSMNDIKPR
jgi:hypothetical protein